MEATVTEARHERARGRRRSHRHGFTRGRKRFYSFLSALLLPPDAPRPLFRGAPSRSAGNITLYRRNGRPRRHDAPTNPDDIFSPGTATHRFALALHPPRAHHLRTHTSRGSYGKIFFSRNTRMFRSEEKPLDNFFFYVKAFFVKNNTTN